MNQDVHSTHWLRPIIFMDSRILVSFSITSSCGVGGREEVGMSWNYGNEMGYHCTLTKYAKEYMKANMANKGNAKLMALKKRSCRY